MPQHRIYLQWTVMRCLVACLAFWCCAFFISPVAHAEPEQKPRVLLLHSYHPHFPWTDAFSHGLITGLAPRVEQENVFVEYMDARRHEDARSLSIFHQLLSHKYAHVRPDVIVTADDAALSYMLKYGRDVFPDVPVVFAGVNNLAQHDLSRIQSITGVKEGTDIVGTIALIKRIIPETQKVRMIADDSVFGNLMVAHAKSAVLQWELDQDKPKLEFEYHQRFSINQLKRDLALLPRTTAVLLLAIHRDSMGQYFSYADELPSLSQISSVPIWSMWGTATLGYGVTGGIMNNGELHGRATADIVLKILNGVPAQFIPIAPSGKLLPKFDWELVERFDLQDADFPLESVFIHKPKSMYETHRNVVLGVTISICVLMAVIAVLAVNVLRRKASEARLDALNRNLETIVSKRTRELHERNDRLEQLSTELKTLAHTDHLTGLGNRRSGTELIEAMMERAEQTDDILSIAMLDVDHFKKINDTFGHDVGDRALRVIADAARNGLRPTDYAFRWGGEELLLILNHLDADGAKQVCERLRRKVAEITASEVYALTISIGIAQFSPGENMRAFIHRADVALYEAKTEGRNQVILAPMPGNDS